VKNRPLRLLLSGILLLVLGGLTNRQTGMYRNPETLWRTTIARNPSSGMAHNNLGLLLFQRGGVNEAMYYLERATTLSPENAEAHNNYGNALRVQGQLAQAIEQFEQASKLRTEWAIYHANLGSALARAGRTREAIGRYETAIARASSDPFVLNNLAWLLATTPDDSARNGARAVEFAERASRLSAGDLRLEPTRAAAYAEVGRFEDAIAVAEKARQRAIADGNARLADLNAQLLELFRAGRPYREN